MNSGNACYRSVQNLLSSRLLSQNIKNEIYRTIILSLFIPAVCMLLKGVNFSIKHSNCFLSLGRPVLFINQL
jgi:hypothetical protein